MRILVSRQEELFMLLPVGNAFAFATMPPIELVTYHVMVGESVNKLIPLPHDRLVLLTMAGQTLKTEVAWSIIREIEEAEVTDDLIVVHRDEDQIFATSSEES